ncbi:MAG TPA: thioredoxin fold domain-containing protein [Rhizobacter sp.]|nr:thioredoxin fold domain-containing protein [Rhizobacter sp.]
MTAAFAQARAEHKPLIVYWGAAWCPPCNQLTATLFNRQDVIERTRAFVPVYVDGDSPGAQKLGARFKVNGYPTLVLFSPQGVELTRLPGEVDAAQYTQLLTLGMNAQRSVKDLLADARAGGASARHLSDNDWRLLAFYAWDTDEAQWLAPAQIPALLKQLAAQCPPELTEIATRLMLKAAAAAGEHDPAPPPDAAARQRLQALLADTAAARAQMDVLTNSAAAIVKATSATKSPERASLVGRFDSALTTLQNDAALSRADRLTALLARVDLAKIDAPAKAKPSFSPALLADVIEHSARMDREISDGYERQAVIPTAAYLLEQAGLMDEASALLQANLAKSHAPYYLMSALAGNAKRRGDQAGALRWSEQAFGTAEGPATRLQWGASYVSTLIELTPQDEARIERTAQQLFAEAAAQQNAFYERSARSLQRVGTRLQDWNKSRGHRAAMLRLQAQLDSVCAGLPADDTQQRATCQGLLKPRPRKPEA